MRLRIILAVIGVGCVVAIVRECFIFPLIGQKPWAKAEYKLIWYEYLVFEVLVCLIARHFN